MKKGTTISHYTILEKLGEGGMGVVYKARDTKLERDVALKFLPQHLTSSEEDKQRFIREAKAAAALNHPNICTIYSVDEDEGNQFIVMEYIDGSTLRNVQKSGNLEPELVISYAVQIAEALSKAHDAGIIHRDIKAGNIMVNADAHIKIMDFGLAKLKGSAEEITKTGSTVGTMAYMAPEQIQGKEVDHRADIFAFGVVLFEMLAGVRPFRGEHEAALTYSIVNEEPVSILNYLAEAPEELERFFKKALAKEPDERFSDTNEIKSILEALLDADIAGVKRRTTVASSVGSGTKEQSSDGGSSTTISITLPGVDLGGRSLLIGIAGIVLAVLIVGWWFVGGTEHVADEEVATEEIAAGQSIAVFPFEVTGAGAEEWEDGMVTTLYLNLDGAAGLRAVADRTVFAALRDQGWSEGGLGTTEALEVARNVNARYALVGSVVQLGADDLRFSVEIYDVPSGERLDRTEARGTPEEFATLTDDLTREVLRILLEGDIPSVNFENITTESYAALGMYLDGERHLRAGDYRAAVESFENAVDEDPNFALAYARLGIAMAWVGMSGRSAPTRRAYELSDRLSERERRLVWAQHTWDGQERPLIARDSLRYFSKLYPDDPRIWYHLGETLLHGAVPGGLPEAENAFEDAINLDPRAAPYHEHLVHIATLFHHSSTLAARRIEEHPHEELRQVYQTFWDLSFGSESDKQEALARLDTLTLPRVHPRLLFAHLENPRDLKMMTEAIKTVRERPDTDAEYFTRVMLLNRLHRGQLEEVTALVEEEDPDHSRTARRMAEWLSVGFPLESSLLRSYLEPPENLEEASPDRLYATGIYLIEEGREKELELIVERLQQVEDRPDDWDTEVAQAIADMLKGYRAFREGNLEEAKEWWTNWRPISSSSAIWKGDLYRELGDLEKAEEWYVAGWAHMAVHERLGQLYEEMGRPEDAAEAYERFITAWSEADEPLQERVEEARERFKRLPGQ